MAGAAEMVYDCDMAGFFFDPEQYISEWAWYWRGMKYYNNPYSFAQYEAQVRLRGQQIAAAMKTACSRQFIFHFLIATSAAYHSVAYGGIPLATCEYGLLPAFVEGLLDEAVDPCGPDHIIVIDGNEQTYGCYTESCFNWYVQRFIDSASISTDPARYLTKVQIGFGTMLDIERSTRGWHTDPCEFEQNYYSPARFQDAIQFSADKGVLSWVWNEIPNWWDGSLHEDYVEAMRAVTDLPGPVDCDEAVNVYGMVLQYDINNDCYINLHEFSAVAAGWLRCNEPTDMDCEHPWE